MQRWHRTTMVVAALGGVAAVSACSSDDPVTPPPAVATVDVTPADDTVRSGTTTQLTATPRDAGGNALTGRTITWATDDPAVATVNTSSGLVTGAGNGMATITATVEGISNSAAITSWIGITGSWTGTITAPAGLCSLDPSITEDNSGNLTGTADLQAPCAPITLNVTGTNNTGAVADSVEITYSNATTSFVLNGNFDGVDAMVGLINGSGCVDCPSSYVRGSIAPAQALRAAPDNGPAPAKDWFLPGS